MLGGEFKHNIDGNNRLFIPAKFREELGVNFVVAKDIRAKCLKVYSPAGWEKYITPIREQKRSLAEPVLRLLHASLASVKPDSQGRITLTKELVGYAGIEDSAMIVGCGDYAEIWAESVYEEVKKEQNANVSELLKQLEELGL